MRAAAERLTPRSFRETYAHKKPYFELLDGEAVQKAWQTNLHSPLQLVLMLMLRELGFKTRPEFTLSISESWEPIPDVCGILPTRAVAVAIEILSPDDRFTQVIQKCRKYAQWGVQDILVFDPIGREAWYWDAARGDLAGIKGNYSFRSQPATINQKEIFRRLDSEL
jgi:Uma2 family endonuclease